MKILLPRPKSKLFLFLMLLLLNTVLAIVTKAQSSVDVPEQIEFAGIKLKLSESYRDSIRKASEGLLKNNRYFRLTVERADAYYDIVERILAEEQVPDDLKFLALQESKLISDVVSGSNAVGYWQFKKETAIEMGLRVDDEVDERMNIVTSTRGAAKYLRRHNAILQNWVYAVLSYYAGLTGARSVINKDKSTYANVTEMELDEHTHWYITKFLAHKLAYETAIHRNPTLPLQVIEYPDCENKTLEEIALSTNVPLEDVAFYNKWARKGAIPGDKDYTVLLPVKALEQPVFMAMQNKPEPGKSENLKPYRKTYFFGLFSRSVEPDQAPEASQAQNQTPDPNTEYKSTAPIFFSWNGIKAIMARKGDNIARLALQAEIDKDDFLDYNDMRIFDLIVAGQVYYIEAKNKKAAVPYHVVKEGETLWEISQNYGIKMSYLMKKNGMAKPEKLKAGRVLWMRHTRPANAPIEYMPVPTPLIPLKPDSSKNKPAGTSPAIAAYMHDTNNVALPPLSASDSVAMLADPEDPKPVKTDSVNAKPGAGLLLPPAKPDSVPLAIQNANKVTAIKENKEAGRPGFETHVLAPGQTLYALSRSLHVPIDSLRAWNNLETNSLTLGMPLYYKPKPAPDSTIQASNQPNPKKELAVQDKPIPKPEQKTEPITQPVSTPKIEATKPAEANEYIVKPGDNMYKIARENGVSVKQIQEWNNKTGPSLAVGEKLVMKK